MRNTGIYYFFTGIEDIYFYRLAEKNRKNPTKEMLESRSFFSENKERIERIISLFIDNESRDCYSKMIDFRCNSTAANFPASNRRTSYFFNEYFSFGGSELLVDCGAYIGDTIMSFKKAVTGHRGKIRGITAFEPNIKNYNVLLKQHKDAAIINAGVWDEDTVLAFNGETIGASSSFLEKTFETNNKMTGGGGGGGKRFLLGQKIIALNVNSQQLLKWILRAPR
jgi:hypothetical protein